MLVKPQLKKTRTIEKVINESPLAQSQFYLKIDSDTSSSPVVWVEVNGILKKLEHLKEQKKQDFISKIKSQKTLRITLYYE